MDEERPRASPLSIVVITLLLSIVPLYAASIGPAAYLLDNGFGAWQNALETFYAPLIWAANNCEPLGYLLKSYMAWWV